MAMAAMLALLVIVYVLWQLIASLLRAVEDGGHAVGPDVDSAGARRRTRTSFKNSNYKRYYREARVPRRPEETMEIVQRMLYVYGKAEGVAIFRALRGELESSARLDSDGEQLACRAAVRLWTSSQNAGLNKEFCSILNEIIRHDVAGPALASAASLARAMNGHLTSGARARWPTQSWKVYRGAGIPRCELEHFTVGLIYRTPMFLATSFKMATAVEFLKRVPDHLLRVIFVFHIDPHRRCRHALPIKSVSGCEDETEFLFSPYSAFTVKSSDLEAPRPSKRRRSGVEHLKVDVIVAPDNLEISEDVYVMRWH